MWQVYQSWLLNNTSKCEFLVLTDCIACLLIMNIFAAKISFSRLIVVCQVSFVYAKVTNHVNWHREKLLSDRE